MFLICNVKQTCFIIFAKPDRMENKWGLIFDVVYMCHIMHKIISIYMQNVKIQISLCIHAVWHFTVII